MPTLTDACRVIERIFDPTLPMTIHVDLLTLPFVVFGVATLILKDFRDEFFPKKILLMNNKSKIIRWLTYVVLFISIMIAGVFGADQFIYANF